MRDVQRSPKREVRIKRQNTAHYLFPSDIETKEDVPKPSIPDKHKKEQKYDSIPPELKTFANETTKDSSKHWKSATKVIPKSTTTAQDAQVQSPKTLR